MFDPMVSEDVTNLKDYFGIARDACYGKGGATDCACSTNPDWRLADPRNSNLTDLYFCLPKTCECADGSIEEMPEFVRSLIFKTFGDRDIHEFAILGHSCQVYQLYHCSRLNRHAS